MAGSRYTKEIIQQTDKAKRPQNLCNEKIKHLLLGCLAAIDREHDF